MWRRYLFLWLLFLLIIFIEISIGATLEWQNKINILLVFIIGSALYYSFEYSLIFLILGGWILDLYSGMNFGVLTISLFLTLIVSYLLIKNFISHKTWWSMSFVVLGSTVLYNIIVLIISLVLYGMKFNYFYMSLGFLNLFWQSLLNILIVFVIYFFRDFLKKYLIYYEK